MTTTASRSNIYCGTTQILNLTVIDADNPTPNTPVNLSGCTVRWALTRELASGQVSATALVSKTAEIVSAVDGTCRVTLLPADTASLTPGAYWQEWEVQDGAGAIDIVAVGKVALKLNVAN